MVKLTYVDLIEEFGVPKTPLFQTLNLLFHPLKITSLKHLWYLILIGYVKKEIVREVINIKNNNNGRETKHLRYEEAYIVA